MAQKKIVGARGDDEGDITAVKFAGNSSFTPLKQAIAMAKRGEIANTHVSRTGRGREYLRTNPDGKAANNLDHMVGDD